MRPARLAAAPQPARLLRAVRAVLLHRFGFAFDARRRAERGAARDVVARVVSAAARPRGCTCAPRRCRTRRRCQRLRWTADDRQLPVLICTRRKRLRGWGGGGGRTRRRTQRGATVRRPMRDLRGTHGAAGSPARGRPGEELAAGRRGRAARHRAGHRRRRPPSASILRAHSADAALFCRAGAARGPPFPLRPDTCSGEPRPPRSAELVRMIFCSVGDSPGHARSAPRPGWEGEHVVRELDVERRASSCLSFRLVHVLLARCARNLQAL